MRRFLVAAALAVLALAVAGAAAPQQSRQVRWAVTVLEQGSMWEATEAAALNARGQVIGFGLHQGIEGGQGKENAWHGFVWQHGKLTDLALYHSTPGKTKIDSSAKALNDRGQVVGSSGANALGIRHAFLWQQGRIRDLGSLGGGVSSAADINNRGQIVGDSPNAAGWVHAFLWQNGKMIDLGTLGGPDSSATAINEEGDIVGWSDLRGGTRHAFLWRQGRMHDLGTLPGKRWSAAVAINGRDQIIGTSFTLQSDGTHVAPHGLLWQKGKLIDLGRLFSDTYPAINERGQIVGTRAIPTRELRGGRPRLFLARAFLWQNGRITYLGMAPHATENGAVAINNHGQIVGWSGLIPDSSRTAAVIWQAGKMTQLPSRRSPSGEDKVSATAINEHGQIVGTHRGRMEYSYALLWRPRPGG